MIPLAAQGDLALAELAQMTGSPAIAALDASTLLTERAVLARFAIPGRQSAGGGCRLFAARDGTIALNLARDADRELLPALFADGALDAADDAAIAARIAMVRSSYLIARGREMGLAIACEHEHEDILPSASPLTVMSQTSPATRESRKPRVLDLSSLWAGPLCGHLLWLAGAKVIKVESQSRPDAMRQDETGFFDVINQGKASVSLDLGSNAGRADLLRLIATSDIVIEASRPRALQQLGIDADAIVKASAGLVWMTITAHGATGDPANWVGFGDDVGYTSGLGAAFRRVTGRPGFVGDAIADPLTGMFAASAAWRAWSGGLGGRYGVAMRDVVAHAMADARGNDPMGLDEALAWSFANQGRLFPGVSRPVTNEVAALGADTQRLLARC